MIEYYNITSSYRAVDKKYSLANGTFGMIIRGKAYKNKRKLIEKHLINNKRLPIR